MSQDVLGLDFEFGNKALPLAVGIAGANGVKEIRFIGVKSPERLNALHAISANGKKIVLISEGNCEAGIAILRKKLDEFLPQNAYKIVSV